MTKDEAIDVEAERKLFEREMNAQRFFPAELDFTRGKSPSGRDEYVNSHLQSNWNGWLAAKRSIAQPTSEAVVTVSGSSVRWLPAASKLRDGTELFAAQPAADPAPVPAQGIDHALVPFIAWEVARHDTGAVDDLNTAEIRETWRSDHAKLAEGDIESFFKRDCLAGMSDPSDWDENATLCMQFARKFYGQGWQARGQQAGVPEAYKLCADMLAMWDGPLIGEEYDAELLRIETAIRAMIAAAADPGEAG